MVSWWNPHPMTLPILKKSPKKNTHRLKFTADVAGKCRYMNTSYMDCMGFIVASELFHRKSVSSATWNTPRHRGGRIPIRRFEHVGKSRGLGSRDSCWWRQCWWFMSMVVQDVDGGSTCWWWLRLFYAYVVVRIHLCHKSSKRTPAKSKQPISTIDQPLVDNPETIHIYCKVGPYRFWVRLSLRL